MKTFPQPFIFGTLVFSLALGCTPPIKKHRYYQLNYTNEVQQLNTNQYHLTPGGAVVDKLGAVNLLLGSKTQRLLYNHVRIDTTALQTLFRQETTRDDDVFSYRFIHLTDIQLRDRGKGLGAYVEHLVDKYPTAATTRNNFYQDHADIFYLAYLLKTIRALLTLGGHGVPEHRFVVHTGDSIHIADRGELEAFTQALSVFLLGGESRKYGCSDCWRKEGWLTPIIENDTGRTLRFFNVIGNHDVLQWGNWDGKATIVRPYPNDITSLDSLAEQVGSIAHGDTPLLSPAFQPKIPENCPAARPEPDSYYSVDHEILDDPSSQGKVIRLVFLNTTETNGKIGRTLQYRATSSAMSERQHCWLRARLTDADRDPRIDHVLVFGHDAAWNVGIHDYGTVGRADRNLGVELNDHSKVLAYFAGHLHAGVSAESAREKGYRFAHFLAPSVMEYPKVFASVSIRLRGDGDYAIKASYMNLDTLAEHGVLARRKPLVRSDKNTERNQQGAFVAWMKLLARRCKSDPVCRVNQLAWDSMEGAKHHAEMDRASGGAPWVGNDAKEKWQRYEKEQTVRIPRATTVSRGRGVGLDGPGHRPGAPGGPRS